MSVASETKPLDTDPMRNKVSAVAGLSLATSALPSPPVNATLQTIINVIDYGMTLPDAVHSFCIHHQWLPDVINIEPNSMSQSQSEELKQWGHQLKEVVFALQILGTGISPQIRSFAKAAIAKCEAAYHSAKNARKMLEPKKRRWCPFLKTNKNKRICLKAFDRAIIAVEKQASKKDQLSLASTPQKLAEEASGYLAHCLQGANAILGFVKWASEGTTGNSAKDKIYQEVWFNKEKCGNFKCPKAF